MSPLLRPAGPRVDHRRTWSRPDSIGNRRVPPSCSRRCTAGSPLAGCPRTRHDISTSDVSGPLHVATREPLWRFASTLRPVLRRDSPWHRGIEPVELRVEGSACRPMCSNRIASPFAPAPARACRRLVDAATWRPSPGPLEVSPAPARASRTCRRPVQLATSRGRIRRASRWEAIVESATPRRTGLAPRKAFRIHSFRSCTAVIGAPPRCRRPRDVVTTDALSLEAVRSAPYPPPGQARSRSLWTSRHVGDRRPCRERSVLLSRHLLPQADPMRPVIAQTSSRNARRRFAGSHRTTSRSGKAAAGGRSLQRRLRRPGCGPHGRCRCPAARLARTTSSSAVRVGAEH